MTAGGTRAPLDADRLRAALSPRWNRVDVVDETPSTNADLLADRNAPDRSVRVAEFQSAGRGRLDRSWTSPPGAGLTVSVLLRPDVPLVRWGWAPLLAGLALAEAVQQVTGVQARLKWPNDLLLGASGRKGAGILVQTVDSALVIGIGVNVSTTADELPVAEATSLALEGAADADRTDLLVALLRRLDARVAQWADCGGDAEACGLAAAYRDVCSTLGADVDVALADGSQLHGVGSDVDDLGRLVVRTDDHTDRTVTAGDVRHVR